MQRLLRLSAIIDALIEQLGRLINWIVIVLILVGVYNVFARYIGRFIGRTLTSNAFIETQWYLFSVIFLLGFAYILKHNQNVRVDFLYARWPPKRKALVNLVGTLLFLLPLCILGIIVAINPILTSWGRLPGGSWGPWEVSPDPQGLPRAPIKSMIIVGFALLAVQGISEIIKHTAVLTGAVEDKAVEAAEEYQHVNVEG
jgi:TRAP-type mannitol/chloroaromatic compound transport system permease small subunit